MELLLDVLNVFNETAEESLATDNLESVSNFGRPTIFVDPRRAMVGITGCMSAQTRHWHSSCSVWGLVTHVPMRHAK